ncbi:MAG TPA: hypothetical protein VII09_05745 [Opitutaceae bacterium]
MKSEKHSVFAGQLWNRPMGFSGPRLILGLLPCLLGFIAAPAKALEMGGANDVTAVSGRTSTDYVRARLANGRFAPESYAFGKGGIWAGAKADATLDKLKFLDVAHTIASPLAGQNYFPSQDPKTTKLLIMVYWGTTHAPEHANESGGYLTMETASATLDRASMDAKEGQPGAQRFKEAAQEQLMTSIASVEAENALREQDDKLNAMMLGYDSWWEKTQGDLRGTAREHDREDLLEELEEDRYFVVLMAYDFQLMWKEKKHKLLWETRFSLRQRHHNFNEDLPAMAQYASQFFGQDSQGLVRKAIPLGHVDIGEVKSLGTVPEK